MKRAMSKRENNDASTQLALGPSNKRHHHQCENDKLPPQAVFPSDLTRDILLRLPVKSLMRFLCVCKQWKSTISDTQFSETHLLNSKVDPTLNHHRLLLPASYPTMSHNRWMLHGSSYEHEVASCSVESLFNNPLTPLEDVDFVLRLKYYIIGSCNGLVCVVADKYIQLWNPSIRLVSRKCPYLDIEDDEEGFIMSGRMVYLGFGYDHVSDKYKAVFVSLHSGVEYDDDDDDDDDTDDEYADIRTTLTKVYTFGDDSWSTFKNLIYDPTNEFGKFVNGTLNWVSHGARSACPDEWVILSFDLEHDTFGEILLPHFEYDITIFPTPAVLKDCLCVYYDNKETHLVVWLMKEYGVKESWTKLMAIPYVDTSVRYKEPLCMSDGGEVLVTTTDDRLVVYDPKDGGFEYPNIQGDKVWREQYVYIESFVSPCF